MSLLPSRKSLPRPFERLALYRGLFSAMKLSSTEPARFWMLPFERLPFRLGESLAEARIPYVFDDALEREAARAVADLLAIIKARFVPRSLDEPVTRRPTLRDECMSCRHTSEGTLERAAAMLAPKLNPLLDCGLLESWLSRGCSGSTLLDRLEKLFLRAFEEEVKTRGAAPFAYLTMLATTSLFLENKNLVKALSIRGMVYERLERAVGSCLFAALYVSAESAFEKFAQKRLGVDLTTTLLLWQTAVNPISFTSIKSSALQDDLNPWLLSPSAASVLEKLYEAVLQQEPSPSSLEPQLRRALELNREAFQATSRSGLRSHVRRHIFNLLSSFDDGRTDWLRMLASVARRDTDLDALIGNKRSLDLVRRHLTRLASSRREGDAADRSLASFMQLLELLSKGDPSVRHIGGLPSPNELCEIGLESFMSFIWDRFSDGRLEEAKSRLDHGRGEGSKDPHDAWQAGRLYRLSSDGRPFLLPLEQRSKAHLFVDLKGFTRRTHRAKEVVMADFMREQFYKPILAAASKHVGGVAFGGASDSPIELHNLLGDAAAFEGSSANLVELALDIRRVGFEYASRLEHAAPSLRENSTCHEISRQLEVKETEAVEQLHTLRVQGEHLRQEIARKTSMSKEALLQILESMLSARVEELTALKTRARQQLLASEEVARVPLEAHLRRLEAWEGELRRRHQKTRAALSSMSPQERRAKLTSLVCEPEHRRMVEIQEEISRIKSETVARRRLLKERHDEVHGFGLETGTYISHGSKAEVIALDDQAFGAQRVAISERINEAARGTARNSDIKTKIDASLERARLERNQPGLSLPFLVYVDSAYGLVLPQELSSRIESSIRDADTSAIEEIAKELAARAARDLARAMGRGDARATDMIRPVNDIYNVGIAVSEEALNVFLEETLAERFHFQRTFTISELHRELQEPFVYSQDPISLVVSVPADTEERSAASPRKPERMSTERSEHRAGAGGVCAVERNIERITAKVPPMGRKGPLSQPLIFRHAGDVQFRGFERTGATGVYELIAPDTRFHRLLTRHHLHDWIEDARENPGCLLTALGAWSERADE